MKTVKKTERTAEKPEVAKARVKTKRNLKARGRIFKGEVIKKFPKRVVIEFERMIYVKKYERYKKSKTKIHARLPDNMVDLINLGDYIKVQGCRPLSKITHFIVIGKINQEKKGK